MPQSTNEPRKKTQSQRKKNKASEHLPTLENWKYCLSVLYPFKPYKYVIFEGLLRQSTYYMYDSEDLLYYELNIFFNSCISFFSEYVSAQNSVSKQPTMTFETIDLAKGM